MKKSTDDFAIAKFEIWDRTSPEKKKELEKLWSGTKKVKKLKPKS